MVWMYSRLFVSYSEVLSSKRLEGRSLLCQAQERTHGGREGRKRVEEATATVMGAVRSLNRRAVESNRKIECSLGARNKEMPSVGRAKTRQDVTATVTATTS